MKLNFKNMKLVWGAAIFLLVFFLAKLMLSPKLAVVQVKEVKLGPIYSYISAVGLVKPNLEAYLPAQANGVLQAVLVAEGQKVKAGQTIMLLDSPETKKNSAEIKASYEKAIQDLFLARQQHERNKKLLEIEAIAQADFDKSLDLLLQAKLNYEAYAVLQQLAREKNNQLVVKAPFAGTVTKIADQLQKGNLVMASEFLCQVAQLNQLIAAANIDELEAERLKLGQKVLVACQGNKEKLASGEVSFIAPIVHQVEGIAKVPIKVTLIGNPLNLRPGNTVELKIIKQQKAQALVLPQEAIITKDGESFVYLVKHGQIEKVIVAPGISDIKNVEVMAETGLKASDLVLVSDPVNLRPGQKVKIEHVAL